MDPQVRKTLLSGIQPIDRMMGGLDSGQLYLLHGEASGKGLSGITFLIEGLKRSEHGALVVSCSPEDAVRRFARVGYDCLDDVFGGRLVILEYSGDLVDQIARPGQLTPALREFEWLLGETRPRRLVFDPVTSIVAGEHAHLEARVAEFAQWTRSLGATALLIEHTHNAEITRLFKPHVAESFRFEVRETAGRAAEFIVFEKSLTLPDQAIEVDPTRGVLLSEGAQALKVSGAPFSALGPDFRLVDFDAPPPKQQELGTISGREAGTQNARRDYTVGRVNETALFELDLEGIEDALSRLVEIKNEASTTEAPALETSSRLQPHSTDTRAEEAIDTAEFDLASELFGEPASALVPDDLGANQSITRQSGEALSPETESLEQSSPGLPQPPSDAWPASASAQLDASSTQGRDAEAAASAASPAQTGRRASDVRISAAMAAKAVETLLSQEKTEIKPSDPAPVDAPPHAPPAQESVDPKNFKVLLIDDEADSCEMIVESLSDFTIEKIHDGVSGLARLISHKPDLVVLDLDLNVIDGFKLLAHIRARLNVPVIIVSSKLVRSSEGLPAAELAADSNTGVSQLAKALAASGYYHLTTGFSTKELTQKARRLIARYRGIESWIAARSAQPSERPSSITSAESSTEVQHSTAGAYYDGFTPYGQFVVEVEKRVKAVIDSGSALSIVGCRVPRVTTAHDDHTHSKLLDIVRGAVRDTDLAATNVPGDVVILLADARASGARAFATRLRDTVAKKLNQEPSVWMRTFPGLEEASEATVLAASPTNGQRQRRRATD